MRLDSLSPLTTAIQEHRYATLDIETDPDDHAKVKLVGFYDGADFALFDSTDRALDSICRGRKYRGFRIYAHFGGRFDFVHLAAAADRMGWIWRAYMAGLHDPAIMMLDVYRGDHVFHFLDSWALFPAPLKDLAEAFCPDTPKGAIDFQKATPDELAAYLRRDCESLYQVIRAGTTIFSGLGTDLKRSIGATALSLFRRQDMQRPWRVKPWTRRLTIPAAVGARCEVYRRQMPGGFVADVNSMYPWVMSRYDPPVHTPRRVGRKATLKPAGVYRVEAEVRLDDPIPPLPCRTDRLLFPVGRFDTIVWGVEAIHAEEAGAKVRVIEGIEWDTEPGAFSSYVDRLYRLRMEGGALSLIAKLMMNSLSGKFGHKGSVLTVIKGAKPRASRPGVKGDYVLNDHLSILGRTDFRESPYMLPHVSGFILACARVELHRLMLRSADVSYCDTDAVYSRSLHPAGTELGGLKNAPVQGGKFYAPKIYCYTSDGRHVARAKGYPKADPCRMAEIEISGLSSIKEYAFAGALFHGRHRRRISHLDGIRLGGYTGSCETRPPVAGRNFPAQLHGEPF